MLPLFVCSWLSILWGSTTTISTAPPASLTPALVLAHAGWGLPHAASQHTLAHTHKDTHSHTLLADAQRSPCNAIKSESDHAYGSVLLLMIPFTVSAWTKREYTANSPFSSRSTTTTTNDQAWQLTTNASAFAENQCAAWWNALICDSVSARGPH